MRMHYLPLSSKMLRRVIASSKKLGFCFTSRSFATLPRDDLQKIVLDVANNFSSVPVTVDSKFDDFKPRDASPRPWDALDTVEMLLIVEEAVDHMIPNDVADSVQSIKEVVDYLATVDFPVNKNESN